MKQFQLRFALLSGFVLAAVGFLAYRAVRSSTLEEQMQHQAIAERIYDEMERSLSQLLEKEERRSTETYLVDTDAPYPFVTAHFQINSDGRIGIVSASETKSDDLEAKLSDYWQGSPEDNRKKEKDAASQRPGTTLALGSNVQPSAEDKETVLWGGGDEEEVTAMEALRSLNKGAKERVARQRTDEAVDSMVMGSPKPAGLTGSDKSRQQMILRNVAEADAPMVGRLLDSSDLLLVRTIVLASQVYRQGAVLDIGRLFSWLHESTMFGGNVSPFNAAFDLSSSRTAIDAAIRDRARYAYAHRFAEPFDDLVVVLTLDPLRSSGDRNYVLLLSALLIAAASLSLFAIHRMVSVAVAFAERRSNFVAAVTHELKTPLTAIRMYGEMLRDGIVPSEAKRDEYYRHITAESERLSRLIDNVLEFSQLEKGNRSINLTTGSVAPVVHQAVELLRPHVEGAGFRLIVECADHLPAVQLDRDALVQVLCNLGDNAVKYAAGSTPRDIELRCRQEDGAVLITVRDHGNGVASRHLGKIFEPFYRGEDELTRRTKGTGLGLALVRSLCERMGAAVTGRNVDTGGFEVEIRLPASSHP